MFEELEAGKRTRASGSYATLSKNYRLSFTVAATDEYSLSEYERCKVFIDKDTSKLALKLTNDDTGCYISKRNGSCEINLMPFSKHFTIIDTVKKIPLSQTPEGLIVIDWLSVNS